MEISPKSSAVQKLVRKAAKSRRGQIEILVEILTLASPNSMSKGVTKTCLAYACGLNFRRFEKYLELLVKKGLLECLGDTRTGSSMYRTTTNGERTRLLLLEAEQLIFGADLDQCEKLSFCPVEDRW